MAPKKSWTVNPPYTAGQIAAFKARVDKGQLLTQYQVTKMNNFVTQGGKVQISGYPTARTKVEQLGLIQTYTNTLADGSTSSAQGDAAGGVRQEKLPGEQTIDDAAGAVGDAITSPFKLFASAEFWKRTGEITVGLIVVGVGLNAIVKEATGVNVGGKVKKAGEMAAFA